PLCVVDVLSEDTRQFWLNLDGISLSASDDPEEQEYGRQVIKELNAQKGERSTNKCRDELQQAIKSAMDIQKSSELAGIMNLRDKHLAPSLTQTRREKKGVVQLMKFGDETKLLEESLPIVEALFNWVNGASFSVADSREIDRENARLLWTGCTFTNLR